MKPTIPRRLKILLPFVFGVSCLTACQSQPPVASQPDRPASLDTAVTAEQSGQPVIAAHEYLRLAQAAPIPQRQDYQLKAVAALLQAGQIGEARTQIANIGVNGLDPAFGVRKQTLLARINIAEGKSDQALRLLNQAEKTRALDPTLLAQIYRVRAQAEGALGNTANAVRALIARERFIVGDTDVQANQNEIWALLTLQDRAAMEKERALTRDPIARAWLDLAVLVREHAAGSVALALALDEWKKANPNHPALNGVFPMLAGTAPGLIRPPRTIALLLPLTSDYGNAARAVHDGFMAMDRANTSADKPEVRVYDIGANAAEAPAMYARALQEGAQFIVGPLGVEAAQQVVGANAPMVPTLLLSHVEREAGGDVPLIQFGLPPEQEAVQAAERAFLDGRRQAALLYADTNVNQRLVAAFREHWTRLGGTIVAEQIYPLGAAEYSAPVKQLLNIPASEARRQALESRLRTKLKFEPRAREDVDAIFLAADAKHARLIKPQLNYFRASHVPVYTTSQVFSGKPDPANDADLDGLMFGDMPWMLVKDGKIAGLRERLQGGSAYANTPLDRVYALGVDAYAIIPHLNRLLADSNLRFGGVSAGLSVDADRRLHRQLLWARFRSGQLRLIDSFIDPNVYALPHGREGAAPRPRP